MLVYGDPQFSCSIADAVARLQGTLTASSAQDLDSVRKVLIQLGQLEQAVADILMEHPATYELNWIQDLTDLAANLFCAAHDHYRADCSIAKIQTGLSRLPLPRCLITLKIPEGFEFYSLFPEQFIYSALRWSQQNKNADCRDVIVIGIRSIGTTLSAVVAATLKREGWLVNRITVRPSGHPFDRALKEAITVSANFAIVVDEGPGISGSSMGAAAKALVSGGIQRARISFLPGHNNEPGSSASPDILEWWRRTPRFFASLSSLQWKGHDLSATLLNNSGELRGKTFVRCEDLSGGLWRRFFAESELFTPPSFASFERSKFLCIAEDGSGLLWRFNGLGSLYWEQAAQRDDELEPFVVGVLGCHNGFCALPWVAGEHLTSGHLSLPIIEHLTNYLIASANGPLCRTEHERAIERLVEMVYWNTKSVFGAAAAADAIRNADAALHCNYLPCYGDGRLGPWEWIRTSDGKIVKADWFGHDADHTLVGRQSLLWDIAGILVEWNFCDEAEQTLIALLARLMIKPDPNALTFFLVAYSAFQMGKSMMCETIVSDAYDKIRLRNASIFYRSQLSKHLRRNRHPMAGGLKIDSVQAWPLPQ